TVGNGGNPSAPTISSFTASPSSITSGQSATLSWNITGATLISISNGVGTVTGTSVQVTPAQTTTYVLTATNGQGSVTAQATVTVISNGGGSGSGSGNGQTSAVTCTTNVSGLTEVTGIASNTYVWYGPSSGSAPLTVQFAVSAWLHASAFDFGDGSS